MYIHCEIFEDILEFVRLTFTEWVWVVIEEWPICTTWAVTKAGCLGSGRVIDPLLPSSTTTDDILGLSIGSCWTHKSPICMHFRTSSTGYDSIIIGSKNSDCFPSFHSLHACKIIYLSQSNVYLCTHSTTRNKKILNTARK